MAGQLIGYARVSTDAQDLTAQHTALSAAGVTPERIYHDQARPGTNRARPGLEKAIAACWAEDTLVATKLDRLARSANDARDIVSVSALVGPGLAAECGPTRNSPEFL